MSVIPDMHPLFPLGFSTLGSPGTTFPEACTLAREHGMQFLELRALAGTTDLPRYFQEHPTETFSPPVRVVGTSLSLLTAMPAEVEEFYRMAALAHRLQAPYLRVFGAGGTPFGPELPQEQLAAAAILVDTVRQHLARQGWRSELLLETHDVFSSADRCQALNRHLEEPLSLLWDSHHTWEATGESLSETWRKIGPLVRHVHYKDSLPVSVEGGNRRYVLPGMGEFPGAGLRDLLGDEAYRGGVSLEWEKLWHPELLPIEEALPRFLRLFSREADCSSGGK